MNKAVETRNLLKVYKDAKENVTVLKGINISIKEGEFVAVVGPSGAGKTTLLHILGTLDRPTEGRVFLGREDVFQLKEKELASLRNRHIGFVFQFFNLIEELTVFENIILAALASSRGWQKKELFFRIEKILDYLEISKRKDFYPFQLSGGEKQKTALARAIVNNPKIILCDEPTGNLDYASAEKISSLLKKLNREEKITIIVATHNLDIAKQADRVLKIKDGVVV